MNWMRASIVLLATGVAVLTPEVRAGSDDANAQFALSIASTSVAAATAGLSAPLRDPTEAGDAEAMNAIGVARLLNARTHARPLRISAALRQRMVDSEIPVALVEDLTLHENAADSRFLLRLAFAF